MVKRTGVQTARTRAYKSRTRSPVQRVGCVFLQHHPSPGRKGDFWLARFLSPHKRGRGVHFAAEST
mgnify:CR=1 FL=1